MKETEIKMKCIKALLRGKGHTFVQDIWELRNIMHMCENEIPFPLEC